MTPPDDDLDTALLMLRDEVTRAHAEPPARSVDEAIGAARARLLAATHPHHPTNGTLVAKVPTNGTLVGSSRRWPRILAAAALVLGLVGVGLVVSLGPHPATAEAKDVLARASAATIGSADEPVGPGQYRFVGTRAWNMGTIGVDATTELSFLAGSHYDVWVPADPTQEWLLDRGPIGQRVWIRGSEEQARALGIDPGAGTVTDHIRARCGDFYPTGDGVDPCTAPGYWQIPNAAFLASLPRDPDLLLARLKRDAPANGRGTAELLVYAADALRSGLVPADLRSALYLALSRIDGLTVTAGAVNLDGRTGTALGIDDRDRSRQEIIVDPTTGTFIGERQVWLGDSGAGFPPRGTVMSYSAVRTAVVDAIGAQPPG